MPKEGPGLFPACFFFFFFLFSFCPSKKIKRALQDYFTPFHVSKSAKCQTIIAG